MPTSRLASLRLNITLMVALIRDGRLTPFTGCSTFGSAVVNVTAILASYSATGIHTICVIGTDTAGNTGQPACAYYAVYDPSGGFVTGGGWINSPAGDAANPSLTGRRTSDLSLSTRKAKPCLRGKPSSSSRWPTSTSTALHTTGW